MPLFNRFTRISAGWRFAYPAYKTIYLSEGYSTPQARQAPPGKDSGRGAACVPGGASLTRPTTPFTYQKVIQHPRSGKRRAAGQGQRARSRFCAGWRLRLTRPTTPFTYQKATQHPRPGKRRRAKTAGAEPLVCRVALRLPGLQRHLPIRRLLNTPGPASAAPPGKDSGRGAACVPGGGYALPGLEFVRPVVNLFTSLAETAGAGGLKIAETFPEGRGSPHGCGLRAVFCTDAASARPEACRDKSKGPRSGDFAGRSPGVQGAAATGRPLCAPCAV
ncbi:Uncharacterised protein [Klebsiella quasipneumoniae]|nr:Uncharacterised protein [Klebsiella quasipneumoniae]